jgi:hypothetical protein
MRDVNQALAAEFGLSPEEYQRVLDIMGRTPSLTELGGQFGQQVHHRSLDGTFVDLFVGLPVGLGVVGLNIQIGGRIQGITHANNECVHRVVGQSTLLDLRVVVSAHDVEEAHLVSNTNVSHIDFGLCS